MSATELNVGTETTAAPQKRSRLPWWTSAAVVAGVLLVLALVRVITGVDEVSSSGTLGAALAWAMPIALAGLGGLWSERAGIVNIGLEGMMILGTWGAAFGAIHGGPWMGLVGAILGGVVGGIIHAIATVYFGVDHIVSGVALNIIALGAAAFLATRFFSQLEGGGSTQSPPLPGLWRVPDNPVAQAFESVESSDIFFVSEVGAILRALTVGVSILTIVGLLLFVASYWILWRTSFGLRLRSCGESPAAAESLGVNVYLYKFVAVIISGGLAGLGGGFLAMVASNHFREGQTGGRGYIGLAAMIFGNWRPGGLLAGSGLFGFMDALQLRGGGKALHALLLAIAILLVALGLWQLLRSRRTVAGSITIGVGVLVFLGWVFFDTIPDDFTKFAPHLTTLLVLAFASQRLRMPAADGKVYRKGEGH